MFPLRCTVRNCTHLLQLDSNKRSLVCESGHLFDRAKQGYWNLLQPQDKKSANPGDRDEVVEARHRWLAGGYMSGLTEALREWTDAWTSAPTSSTTDSQSNDPPAIADLGCGEGTFGEALFANSNVQFCGIDLSRKAIRLATRRWPTATWVLANADRELPASAASLDGVLSLFGRRPASEIARVLKPSAQCVVAVPGEDDLIELRELAQGTGKKVSRWEPIVEELSTGLNLVSRRTWRVKLELQPDAVRDALTMTYRAARHSEQARLESNLSAMAVTLSADLMLFEKA